MTVYQILCLVGVPSIISGFVGYLIGHIKYEFAMRKGVQALLRDALLHRYHEAVEQGYADDEQRQNFENLWEQYHNMGRNGVMNTYHDRFQQLPDRIEE